jgi:peptidyl-dipeptidase Dcp
VRLVRYAIDDAEVKPYFRSTAMVRPPSTVPAACSACDFVARDDLPVYHPDVRAYEVSDAQGRVVGVFLQDNFARRQQAQRGVDELAALAEPQCAGSGRAFGPAPSAELPVILNNNNFAKGAAESGEPTLLSLDDARTLFHEFGHGLHGLLSNVTYASGCRGPRCCVTLSSCRRSCSSTGWPSPRCCVRHARHWKTGEPMPEELMRGCTAARQLQPGLRDRALHRQRAGGHGGAFIARCRAAGRPVRL